MYASDLSTPKGNFFYIYVACKITTLWHVPTSKDTNEGWEWKREGGNPKSPDSPKYALAY